MRSYSLFQAKFIAIDIFSGSGSIIRRKRLSAVVSWEHYNLAEGPFLFLDALFGKN